MGRREQVGEGFDLGGEVGTMMVASGALVFMVTMTPVVVLGGIGIMLSAAPMRAARSVVLG